MTPLPFGLSWSKAAARAEGRAALIACALLLPACGKGEGPPFTLEGSLSVLLDLRYDIAHVQLGDEELSLRFVRAREDGEDIPMKVTVNLLGKVVEAGEDIDLAEENQVGEQRGVVSRNVFDDPLRVFPRLQRGRVVFGKLPTPGARVPGEVSFTFANGTELASGRTVFGSFEANVE